MRARAGLTAGVALLLVGVSAPAAVLDDIIVTIYEPVSYAPAIGRVEIVADVVADEPIERVAFYVDGVVVGELTAPPYELDVDLPEENRQHLFEVIAYGASGATGRGDVITPRIRVDEEVTVSLQQLYVTATDDGERVLDLDSEEFTVLDRGARQRIVTFARGDIPFTATILLDSSESMAGEKLQAALEGARAFIDGMRPLDEGRLMVFSDRILHLSPYTTFPEVLTLGLDSIRARGGTALNDHLYLALRQLEERQGRRVVILLSDGIDSHSVLSMEDALERTRRSQALVYWLRLPFHGEETSEDSRPSLSSPWRNRADHREQFELLKSAVEESGGRIADLGHISEIAPTFRNILQELREQYVLGFYPPDPRHDGSWRRVEVRAARPGVRVRARGGYIDQ